MATEKRRGIKRNKQEKRGESPSSEKETTRSVEEQPFRVISTCVPN